jgi:hypothetical protein
MSEAYWCVVFVWVTFALFILKEWRDFDELD